MSNYCPTLIRSALLIQVPSIFKSKSDWEWFLSYDGVPQTTPFSAPSAADAKKQSLLFAKTLQEYMGKDFRKAFPDTNRLEIWIRQLAKGPKPKPWVQVHQGCA